MDERYPALVPWWLPSVAAAVIRTRRLLRALGTERGRRRQPPTSRRPISTPPPALSASVPPVVNLIHEQDSARRPSARFAYRRFGAVMAIGANAAAEYRRRLPGVPVAKVNNFLPADYFRAGRRAASGLPPRSANRQLGVLARMIPEKGIAELVEELAADRVRPLWAELLVRRLLQDSAYMRRSSNGESRGSGLGDRVRLLGEVEDVPGFLASIDAARGSLDRQRGSADGDHRGARSRRPGGRPRASSGRSDYEGLPVARLRETRTTSPTVIREPPAAARRTRRSSLGASGPTRSSPALESAAQAARARS